MKTARILAQLALFIVIVVGVVIITKGNKTEVVVSPSPLPEQKIFTYLCNEGKTIQTFYGKDGIQITLSDGRSMALTRSRSTDEERYSNQDNSFVFLGRGNGALILENNKEKGYIGCILVAQDPGGLPIAYANGSQGFTIRLPGGFITDETHQYIASPSKKISGVRFTIAKSLADGTNLGQDSYISIEQIPGTKICSADMFLDGIHPPMTVIDNEISYSVATSSGAGAGNRYEETIYALPWTRPCMAIRYLVHYGVFENYPAGSVKRFDQDALLKTFDSIRKTLIINQ